MEMNKGVVSKINLAVLFACVVLVFVFYPKKELYYDEPFQIMASKGVTNLNVEKFDNLKVITSADFNKENTLHNVFKGGGDSIHYVFLHYFILLMGNGLDYYVLFAVFWGILCLFSFFLLCRLVFNDSIIVALAVVLLFAHLSFLGQLYSVRHYMMALFFITTAGLFFFKYIFQKTSAKNLILLIACCIMAIWSHFFSIFIVGIFFLAVLYKEKLQFFTRRNSLILAVSLIIFLIYEYFHNPFGSLTYVQSYKQAHTHIGNHVTLKEAISLFMKNVAINFDIIFVIFRDVFAVRLGCLLVVLAFYVSGVRILGSRKEELFRFNLLFVLAIACSVFIAFIGFFTQNPAYFVYRYVFFGVPFCVIFISYFISVLFQYSRIKTPLKFAVLLFLIAPISAEFFLTHSRHPASLPCNHMTIVSDIVKNDVHDVALPKVVDALFINCMLPRNYVINYHIDSVDNNAVLYNSTNQPIDSIPIINNELIVLF